MKSKILDVKCKCGSLIFRYKKTGSGTLIKCFRDNIIESNIEIEDIRLLEKVLCPVCNKDIGYWNRIRGQIALKLNNGSIEKIRI